MPPLVIPDTVQVGLQWSLSGQPWAINVLHYKWAGGAVGQAQADDIAATVGADLIATGLRPFLGTNWSFTSVAVRDLRTANQPLFIGDTADVAGTATTETLPPQNCIVVTLRTNQAGRSFRGRVYLSGFSEGSSSSNGQILQAPRDESAQFIEAIREVIVPVSGVDMELAVASRTLLESNVVTSILVRDAVWDCQRRRRDGITQS